LVEPLNFLETSYILIALIFVLSFSFFCKSAAAHHSDEVFSLSEVVVKLCYQLSLSSERELWLYAAYFFLHVKMRLISFFWHMHKTVSIRIVLMAKTWQRITFSLKCWSGLYFFVVIKKSRNGPNCGKS
jgi:hypothetical protein